METISINDISHFLISNSYLLTALELDFELIERGMENKFLRTFFTNPENFENVTPNVEIPTNRIKASPSISTIDSIDFAKYSDDGLQQSDERIKVLEFELRKKNDEVKKLREELTLISTSKHNKSFVVDWIPEFSEQNENYETNVTKSLMAHENRALNFLINEYLLQHGFKLTAVSFSEEIVDQDLDTWDDVGLNIPKLPSLEFFIVSKRPIIEETSSKDTSKMSVLSHDNETQTDPLDQELLDNYINSNRELQNTLDLLKIELEMENVKYEKLDYNFQEQIKLVSHLKKELNDARSKLICTQRDLMYESAKRKVISSGGNQSISDMEFKSETISILSDAVNDINNCENIPIKDNYLIISQNKYDNEKLDSGCDGGIVTNMLEEIVTQRNPTPAFIKALTLFTDDNHPENKLVNLVDNLDQFVSLVTDILPNLFDASQDKNNPDLIMLLVQCTCLNSDSKVRERLLRFLINLYPEPSISERSIIMKQIQTLSCYLGAFRIEAELITQIWEMLYEKPKPNSSQRILLANICGIISPLAPSNLRSSLILSIHQQMLEEENDTIVVSNIISSIASTIPHLEDVDKIPHCIQIIANYLWKSDLMTDCKKNVLDNNLVVEEVVKYRLLPAVAQWCLDAGILHSSLLFNILMSMKNLNLNVNNIDYNATCLHLNIIRLLIPFIDVWIKLSTPQITEDVDLNIISNSVEFFDYGKLMELYRTDLIINCDKYDQINKSFLQYTGKSIPKSLISSPSKNSTANNESIQCWTPWPELMWLQTELINSFVYLLKNIRPRVEKVDLNDSHIISDLAKNQFTIVPLKSKDLCLKIGSILFELGCRFSSSVINSVFISCFSRYLFESSDKGVDCNLKSDVIGTGIVSGYCALLAALAHLDSSNFALDNLKKFLTNISFLVAAESLPLDGVRLSIDVLCSEFGNISNTSLMIIASLQPCIACPNASVRIFVCLMLQELLIQLSSLQQVEDLVFIGILDSLRSMIDCSYEAVKVMTIGPLVSLTQAKSISLTTCTQVFHCLSKLMDDSVNFKPDLVEPLNTPCTELLITTLIQMINVVGPTCPDNFKDEAILPWLLGITEINNQTKDIPRRSGIAMILYSTFSTLSYYLISSNSLETCLLPALDRLKLDMIELYPENVKEVESMSFEIRKRIEIRQKSNLDNSHHVKNKISGLNFMTRTANVTSSATSSILGKFKDLKDSNFSSKSDDVNDQVSTTKTNITNFFSKRR